MSTVWMLKIKVHTVDKREPYNVMNMSIYVSEICFIFTQLCFLVEQYYTFSCRVIPNLS